MARIVALLVSFLCFTICKASTFYPISDGHIYAAKEFFLPISGRPKSLEDTYEALRIFNVLGIEERAGTGSEACSLVAETLGSPTSNIKDIFYALKLTGLMRCQTSAEIFEGIIHRVKAFVKDASSLVNFYYSIGSLVLIQDQGLQNTVPLKDAVEIFHAIKTLSQTNGRWRYDMNDAESSVTAAGMAIETLAGLVKIGSSEIDQTMIDQVKDDIEGLFDAIDSYDDGVHYFVDKVMDGNEHGPISTTAMVVRGYTAFAAVFPGRLNIPADKILGLARFFLSIGIPGNLKDLFNQMDALAYLENNRVSIPLVLSVPSVVLSLTSKDLLKVKVNTVLGSDAPPLTVKLVQAVNSLSKENVKLQHEEFVFDTESKVYSLDLLSNGVDVGKYKLIFEVLLHAAEDRKLYATGPRVNCMVYIKGIMQFDQGAVSILDSDTGSVDISERLDLSAESSLSLSANHLQKLCLSFHLASPLGQPVTPHQVFLLLRNVESQVEHKFVVSNVGKHFEIVLDFLGLVDKFFYLSGRYDMQLTIGDVIMENSFFKALGHVNLDLPNPPEKAARPPPQPKDPYTRFEPKPEISHIFREREKRPPEQLSKAFLVVTLLPAAGFFWGLTQLGVNLKNFPSSTVPAIFTVLFHVGLAAVLLLYALFWLKLNLFTTLKALGFLGALLVFLGHRTLANLSFTAEKQKSA